jgi:hypothetical protein
LGWIQILSEYLGIKLTRDDKAGMFMLMQTGLIEKIAGVTSLTHCSANKLLASQVALGPDPDGEPIKEKWKYAPLSLYEHMS